MYIFINEIMEYPSILFSFYYNGGI